MTFEEALHARLAGDTGLAALIGDRLAWDERPEKDALPAVTITDVAPGRAYTHGGPSGCTGSRIQVDCWSGEDGLEARAVFDALDAVLGQPAAAPIGGIIFDMAFLVSKFSAGPEDVPGQEPIFRIVADFTVWWRLS